MTIKSQIVLLNLIVFGILISALAYYVYSSTVQSELEAVDLRLNACAAKIITEFEDEWEEEEFPEWDDIMFISVEGLSDVNMTMRSIDGHLIFGNDTLQPPSDQLVPSILKGESSAKTVSIDGREIRHAVFPVVDDDNVEFTLTLATSFEESRARLNHLALILVGSVILVLIIASVVIYFATRFLFKPVSSMISTAEQISADKLGERIELPPRNDEVARLGKALNDMMERIEAAFKSQRQFVSDASHELRTPLTVIIGELEFIQSELSQNALKENIKTTLDELDRLTRLVDQLLTLARIDTGRLVFDRKRIRLDEIVVDCVRLLRNEIEEKKIEMQMRVENAIEIDADPVKLKSVILNLIDNAVRYDHIGGNVQIELEEIQLSQSVQLTVSNTGLSIPPQERDRVFDRFYRGVKSRGNSDGSGLGLAIARELIELHGGRIELGGSQEGDTLFRVILPTN